MQALEAPRRMAPPTETCGVPVDLRGTAPGSGEPHAHRWLVLYGSRFGNTQRIAEALASGLREASGLPVDCMGLEDAPVGQLDRYEFIAIGGPTEVFSASKSMKVFLEKLPAAALRGKRGFAFDTRLASRLSGSAGRYIENHLQREGVEIARPHASATVRSMNKEERARHGDDGAPDWARKLQKTPTGAPVPSRERLDLLVAGAEAEFLQIGAELGVRLKAAAATRAA